MMKQMLEPDLRIRSVILLFALLTLTGCGVGGARISNIEEIGNIGLTRVTGLNTRGLVVTERTPSSMGKPRSTPSPPWASMQTAPSCTTPSSSISAPACSFPIMALVMMAVPVVVATLRWLESPARRRDRAREVSQGMPAPDQVSRWE